MSEILKEIYGRMLENEEFTFLGLHARLPDEAYRLADRTLQSFRRKGLAKYRRDGRSFVWSLTAEGRAYLSWESEQ